MKASRLTAALAALCAAAPAAAVPADAIVAEMNRVRANPSAYARELQALRGYYYGRIVREPGQSVDRLTMEGVAALDEAISALRRQRPVGPLSTNYSLAAAADDHVRTEGPGGMQGHIGINGSEPLDRVLRRGVNPYAVGEVIAYGPTSAVDVVRELIIDDGVYDRGHRLAMFDPVFSRAGAACGPHRVYRVMCVVDLASDAEAPANARRIRF